MCRKPLDLEIDDECPEEWVKKLVPMAVCTRCGEFWERREKVTNRIKHLCERMAGLQDLKPEVRKAMREKFLVATRDFAQMQADFFRAPSVMWNAEFADMLMDQPLKWGNVLNVYRQQFKAWLRQYQEGLNATPAHK
jgi:hypothetical protein